MTNKIKQIFTQDINMNVPGMEMKEEDDEEEGFLLAILMK